jgi:hypothetical protein
VVICNNKPPGLTNYNVELEPEPIDSLQLSAINWQISEHIDWIENEPSWMVYDPNLPRRTSIRDALALMSEYVLDIMQPYLGDFDSTLPSLGYSIWNPWNGGWNP